MCPPRVCPGTRASPVRASQRGCACPDASPVPVCPPEMSTCPREAGMGLCLCCSVWWRTPMSRVQGTPLSLPCRGLHVQHWVPPRLGASSATQLPPVPELCHCLHPASGCARCPLATVTYRNPQILLPSPLRVPHSPASPTTNPFASPPVPESPARGRVSPALHPCTPNPVSTPSIATMEQGTLICRTVSCKRQSKG